MATKKTEDATNEVATQDPNARALAPIIDYGADFRQGLDDVGQDEAGIPFLKILQPQSPEVIGDADRFGLDAVFPAALLAIIGNLLRQRLPAIAATIGGGLCLVLVPVAPAGIPIIASLLGAVVALAWGERTAELEAPT